jgi:hypothetical protein
LSTTITTHIAPPRRRSALRLGVRGLLATPLALSLALPGEARGDDTSSDGTCSGSSEIVVDGQPAPRCALLLGDADAREDNQAWRAEHIMAVESGSRTLDVVHTDAKLRRPEARSLPGMVVREIFEAEVIEEACADEGAEQGVLDAGPDTDAGEIAALTGEPVLERVARVELSERWAEVCEQDAVVLRVDDALGARGRVVHIDRRGVLAHLGGRLVWLSRLGAEAPVFRTTWRSGFSVVTNAVAKPAAKPQPKATRNRSQRGSRRR